ncbi:hypothetical protein ACOME3_008377 [Neoechinorhynchus agilis]
MLNSIVESARNNKDRKYSPMDLHCLPVGSEQEHMMGTTILAIEYDGGVIMAADTRTSIGTFVFNRYTDKITKLSDRIYCCRSGSAADTQTTAEIISYNLEMLSAMTEEEPSVKMAATVAHNFLYEYREQLVAGMIVAGYDEKEGGQVYSLPLGGMVVRQPIAMGGSGSTYLYGYMDSQYRSGMNKNDALEFMKNAVTLAITRDNSSGGCVRIAVIDKNGIERHTVAGNSLPTFYTD